MSDEVLMNLLFQHIISGHQNDRELVNFILLVEKVSGTRMETPEITDKCNVFQQGQTYLN